MRSESSGGGAGDRLAAPPFGPFPRLPASLLSAPGAHQAPFPQHRALGKGSARRRLRKGEDRTGGEQGQR
eukprot:4307485-Prymnesium_polylepis.1